MLATLLAYLQMGSGWSDQGAGINRLGNAQLYVPQDRQENQVRAASPLRLQGKQPRRSPLINLRHQWDLVRLVGCSILIDTDVVEPNVSITEIWREVA